MHIGRKTLILWLMFQVDYVTLEVKLLSMMKPMELYVLLLWLDIHLQDGIQQKLEELGSVLITKWVPVIQKYMLTLVLIQWLLHIKEMVTQVVQWLIKHAITIKIVHWKLMALQIQENHGQDGIHPQQAEQNLELL